MLRDFESNLKHDQLVDPVVLTASADGAIIALRSGDQTLPVTQDVSILVFLDMEFRHYRPWS
jgi:hypothetical protein